MNTQKNSKINRKPKEAALPFSTHRNVYPASNADFQEPPAKDTVVLIAKAVSYYSPKDEDAFFEWLTKIKSIIKCYGVRDELFLHAKSNVVSQEDLRELVALFCRYNIDTNQLKVFIAK